MRSSYEKGKNLEQSIRSLIEKLNDFFGNVSSASGTWAIRVREAITISEHALSTAKSVKEALGSSVCETGDMDRASKRIKTGQEALCQTLETSPESPEMTESDPECPEIITTVADILLKRSYCSASLLLLGLRDDGKKELVNELVKNFANDGMVKLFAMDMAEYSDETSLENLKNSPLRTLSNRNENLDLVEAVKKHPSSIFYFDKIEKAHVRVHSLLLSLLRYGVMIDNEGNGVDCRRAVFILGCDSGNKHAFAQLARHGGEVDSTSEVGSELGKQELLRFEVLCKVDKLVVFNPFAKHQLRCSRSYQVEDLRDCGVGSMLMGVSCIFSLEKEPEMEPWYELAIEKLAKLRSNKENKAQKRLPTWYSLPDPFHHDYRYYLSVLPFV